MSEEVKIIIRPSNPHDMSFIFATWLKGNYYGTHFGLMPQDLYYSEYSKVIERITSDPMTLVRIACDEAKPNWIVGFSVSTGPVLHWVHVKRDFRQRGIANLLTHTLGITTVKALTRAGRAISERKKLIYNPLTEETVWQN